MASESFFDILNKTKAFTEVSMFFLFFHLQNNQAKILQVH